MTDAVRDIFHGQFAPKAIATFLKSVRKKLSRKGGDGGGWVMQCLRAACYSLTRVLLSACCNCIRDYDMSLKALQLVLQTHCKLTHNSKFTRPCSHASHLIDVDQLL
jgi:hypothetical protein